MLIYKWPNASTGTWLRRAAFPNKLGLSGWALSSACCCGGAGCVVCGYPSPNWPNQANPGYKWRVLTGDWDSCDGYCDTSVWDDVTAKGGAPGGLGIDLDLSSPYCVYISENMTSCYYIGPYCQTTPITPRLVISSASEVVNGVCWYYATFYYGAATFTTNRFNPCATESDPNVFSLVNSGLSCCNQVTEIEIWSLVDPPCDQPVP